MNIVVAWAHCRATPRAAVMVNLGVQHEEEDHPLLSRASQLQHLNKRGKSTIQHKMAVLQSNQLAYDEQHGVEGELQRGDQVKQSREVASEEKRWRSASNAGWVWPAGKMRTRE